MTAQKLVTNKAVHNQEMNLQDTIKVLLVNTGARRWIWICEICGMAHPGNVPDACECCGSTRALKLQEDTRREMGFLY